LLQSWLDTTLNLNLLQYSIMGKFLNMNLSQDIKPISYLK